MPYDLLQAVTVDAKPLALALWFIIPFSATLI